MQNYINLLNKKTELCEFMKKEGSDKSTGHNYTYIYNHLFKNLRNKNIKLLEVGLGTNNVNLPSNMGISGIPLASVRGWKKYFKRAKIYGADIDKDILKDEPRIKTFYIDQLNSDSISDFKKKTKTKFDIIIDDGLHNHKANYNLFINLLDTVNFGGYYIIEDLNKDNYEEFKKKLDKFDLMFDIEFLEIPHDSNKYDNRLIILRKKELSFDELIQPVTLDYLKNQPCDEFYKFFDFEELKINHKKNKVFSLSLFNQNVNSSNPSEKNPMIKKKFLDGMQNLIKLINKEYPEFGINFFIDPEFKDLNFENSNVYIFKNKIYGAIGMLWRYLSMDFDYVDEVYICDLDLRSLSGFNGYKEQNNNCRYLSKGKIDYYVNNNSKYYTPILGSFVKLLKRDFNFAMKDLICKFLYYQKYILKDTEKYSVYGNNPFWIGFGNTYYTYGIDERFLGKIIYPYLVNKSSLTTFYYNFKNIEDNFDIKYCKKKGNKVYDLKNGIKKNEKNKIKKVNEAVEIVNQKIFINKSPDKLIKKDNKQNKLDTSKKNFHFIHNFKAMGTTIYSFLDEDYKKKYYGQMTFREYEKKNNVKLNREFIKKNYCNGLDTLLSIDHIHIDDLIELGIFPKDKIENTTFIFIFREPIERFLSICNFKKLSPKLLIRKLKGNSIDETRQIYFLTSKYDLNFKIIKMDDKEKIKDTFNQFGISIDLNTIKNKSENLYKKTNLDENQVNFIRKFYKEDIDFYKSL